MVTPIKRAASDQHSPERLTSGPSFAALEALMIVGLWSATPPLAKVVMVHLPPLEFLGVRYFVAFLALTPLVLKRTNALLRRLSAKSWLKLVLMGLLAYPVANGLQFWALTRLSATIGTFTMNFVPIFALVLGIVWLSERPTRIQSIGIVIALAGAVVFFGLELELKDVIALAASSLGSLVLAINAVLARSLARSGKIDSVCLSAIPLGVGGGFLVLFFPPSSLPPNSVIVIIAFLAVVSGSLAFTVWNHAIKKLQAFEITLVGNLMPMGTAVVAPLILGEVITGRMWAGLTVALIGVVLVALRPQMNRERRKEGLTV